MDPIYKVSVVIPVYNREKYIQRCVESIAEQTLKNIQIIIVNDGSTDRTWTIINKLKQLDGRITIINLDKNQGTGNARNEGIKAAQGEYIGFVDSDDVIDKEMYKTLYEEIAGKKLDMAMCSLKMLDEDSKSVTGHFMDNEVTTYFKFSGSRVQQLKQYYQSLMHMLIASSCIKIFKRDLIKDKAIYFPSLDEVISEDFFFCSTCLIYANGIAVIPKELYTYVRHKKAYMNSDRKRILERQINMMYQLYFLYKEQGLKEVYELFWNFYPHYQEELSTLRHLYNDRTIANKNEFYKYLKAKQRK